MDIYDIMFFGMIGFFFVIITIAIIKKVKKNKNLALSIKPNRQLSQADIEAIKYLEIESNLTVNLLFKPKVPKREIDKSVWRFSNIDFVITTVYRAKRIIHHFHLAINGQVIEIVIPEIFLPYLKEGQHYTNKTIELLYRKEFFVLFAVSDEISYLLLHKKFKLGNIGNIDYITKRLAVKVEKEAFIFSKWTSVWALMAPIILPMLILAIISEGAGLAIIFLPIMLLIVVPLRKAYKKRQHYVESRFVYTLKGSVWFDETDYKYKINDMPLKLHRKWKKALKKVELPIIDIEVEVLMHTYDTLNLTAIQSFQPIAIKSDKLTMNEKSHPSTRSWLLPLFYLIPIGFIVFLAPLPQNQWKGHIIVYTLEYITSPYIFPIISTLIWWASIVFSIYLIRLVIIRIKDDFF